MLGGNPGAIRSCRGAPRFSHWAGDTVSHKPHAAAFQKLPASQLAERTRDGHPAKCRPVFVIAKLAVGALEVTARDEASYLLGALVLDQFYECSCVQNWFGIPLEIQTFNTHSSAASLLCDRIGR